MTAVTYTIYSLITVIIVSFLDFGCFGTIAGKVYFVVAILGAMLRKDEYGIASYVRAVNLKGQHYEALDYFFHTTTWSLTKIRTCWFGMIVKFAPLYEKNGRNVCVEDHTKKSKEGRYVPLVNRMYQESETQSKATYVFGHMYGGCSILACRGNNISSLVAIPFLMQIHSNMSSLLTWAQMSLIGLSDAELRAAQNMIRAIQDLEVSTESSINRLVLEGCKYAQWAVRDMYLVADRAFLTYKALNAIDAHNKCSKHRVDLVTRCKTGYTAYTVKCDENGKLVADKAIKLGNILSFNTKNVRKLINPEDKSIIWHREDISMYGVTEHVRTVCAILQRGGVRRGQRGI